MPQEADQLIDAQQRRDAVLFRSVCQQLFALPDLKLSTGKRLVEIASEEDAKRGELAVHALRYSGLILEDDVFQSLLRGALEKFDEGELVRLADCESSRPPTPRRLAPNQIKLLE